MQVLLYFHACIKREVYSQDACKLQRRFYLEFLTSRDVFQFNGTVTSAVLQFYLIVGSEFQT